MKLGSCSWSSRSAAGNGKRVGRVLLRGFVGALGLVVLFVALNIGLPLDPLDTLIALLIIFGPWAAGALTGSLWGQTWFGFAAAVVLGVVSTCATLAAFLFLAGSNQENALWRGRLSALLRTLD
jgi:hypothetical protein